MKRINDLIMGWVDTSIGRLLHDSPAFPQQFAFAVITSIDSTTDLTGMAALRDIVRRNSQCQFLGGSLVVPANLAGEVAQLFTGFDEIWWFDQAPKAPKPPEASLVAPLNLSTEQLPAWISLWMKESACRLGLGDGIGLNFVTPDETVGRLLDEVPAR